MVSAKFIQDSSAILAMEETAPLLKSVEDTMNIPSPTFTLARKDARGRKMPQAIAHRGYKAAHPENTMGAFVGAVDVGAHAIETDIHLSKDGVVVLSHDATLKRCFGQPEKIIDCDWSYLETLRTLKEPSESMPRLKDLLEYITTPGLEDIWLLLDIKLDNNDDDVMRLIASTIADVPAPVKPWKERIVLGCWAAKYLPLCAKYLTGFPISHIGYSIAYARQLLKVPSISFNMLQKALVGPFGNKFLRDCQADRRAVYVWTVNEEFWMRWSIGKGVDGVITDDPKKFLEVCGSYDESAPTHRIRLKEYGSVLFVNFLIVVFSGLFRLKYGFKIDTEKMNKDMVSIQSSGSARKLA